MAVLLAGHAVMGAWVLAADRLLALMRRRELLDNRLPALPPAAALVTPAVLAVFPLALRGWNAHGFGATGGEANALLHPWLRTTWWQAPDRCWQRRR